jgi:succinyl-diaminopimelate desuccinylase
LILDLERLSQLDIPPPANVGAILERAAETIDRAQGNGASAVLPRITVNIGMMQAGVKVNMIPSQCVIEADIRLPVGVEKAQVLEVVDEIVGAYPQVTYEEFNYSPPSWCDPEHEMVGIVQANAKALRGIEPQPICSLGGTDTRLWRYRNVPAYVYGPSPTGMGTGDEHVPIEDFLHIVRTHVLSAYDYLTQG